MKQTYSPKDVAKAVGVSESSLKRWADDGRLNVIRTVGGHRRITFHEAIRFARESTLPIVRPDILGLPELAKAEPFREHEASDALQTLLTEGKAEDTRALLIDLYLRGTSAAAICDGPVREVMSRMGEQWHCDGARGIYLEHRATDTILQAMTALRAIVGQPTSGTTDEQPAPVALGGAPSGDPYLLPSIAIALTLCEQGLHEINLGPDTPVEALVAAAQQYQPRLLWLSCSVTDVRPKPAALVSLLDYLDEHQAVLVTGGRGFIEKPLKPHPRVKLCDSMTELAAFVDGFILKAA
ncbi:MAG: helix-turn-helix domain-containing protein [Planctomycetota bacterium]